MLGGSFSCAHINDLPEELLPLIFQHIPPLHYFLQPVGLVNRLWFKIERHVFKDLNLTQEALVKICLDDLDCALYVIAEHAFLSSQEIYSIVAAHAPILDKYIDTFGLNLPSELFEFKHFNNPQAVRQVMLDPEAFNNLDETTLLYIVYHSPDVVADVLTHHPITHISEERRAILDINEALQKVYDASGVDVYTNRLIRKLRSWTNSSLSFKPQTHHPRVLEELIKLEMWNFNDVLKWCENAQDFPMQTTSGLQMAILQCMPSILDDLPYEFWNSLFEDVVHWVVTTPNQISQENIAIAAGKFSKTTALFLQNYGDKVSADSLYWLAQASLEAAQLIFADECSVKLLFKADILNIAVLYPEMTTFLLQHYDLSIGLQDYDFKVGNATTAWLIFNSSLWSKLSLDQKVQLALLNDKITNALMTEEHALVLADLKKNQDLLIKLIDRYPKFNRFIKDTCTKMQKLTLPAFTHWKRNNPEMLARITSSAKQVREQRKKFTC